ncbi:class I adenylate-forming enzyme family protein [Bradyrhizobium sp. AZCC 1693]|uniref:class I adenylate-forming enzyme family protein n=1 Tax=Bradyrhizobium sp. AZCC 1693 TaxID=3117029 RepID=UPI002FF273D7
MLLIDFFKQGVVKYPDRVCVTDGELTYTFAEIDSHCEAGAQALLRAGVLPGESIGIVSPNHPHVLTSQYLIQRAGTVWVPLNYRNSTDENVRHAIKLDCVWLFYHSSLAEQAIELMKKSPMMKGAVCIDKADGDRPYILDWLSQPGKRVVLPDARMDDAVCILSSGGTTGASKGVVHNSHSFGAMTASFYATMHFDEPPVHLVVAPLTHAAGVLNWALLPLGTTTVIQKSTAPADILANIEKYKISVLFMPPTLIYMLLSDPNLRKYDYSTLRYFMYGAAPMSVEKLRLAADAFGHVMMQCYGQTECMMAMTVLTREDHAEILSDPALNHRITSVGRAGPFSHVEIMDDEGQIVTDGAPGEIVCRSGLLMVGYYKQPEETAATRLNGWHRSGDVGYKDRDGYFYLTDRKRELIITGGFNVYPSEVEQALMCHHMVQDCAVVGAPDEKWGERIVAAVEVRTGCILDVEELIAFCKSRIGSVKAPKQIEVWDRLPRSTVGKVLRREVRSKFWVESTRQI